MMMRIACWLTRRRLGAYQDGELPPAVRVRTAAHLATCSACAAELGALARLRDALVGAVPEPPEAVWQAFWPQVRARLAVAPAREPARRPVWGPILARPRLALASAVAVAAVAVLATLAPWEAAPPRGPAPTVPAPITVAPDAPQHVVVQSVEMADPQSSAMVFTNADSDLTIVWVFGLERTEI